MRAMRAGHAASSEPAAGSFTVAFAWTGALVFAASLSWFFFSYFVRFGRPAPDDAVLQPIGFDLLAFSLWHDFQENLRFYGMFDLLEWDPNELQLQLRWFSADHRWTVVAGYDLIALGCYDVFAERGIVCPDEVSVVGFNDMPFLDKLRPPLTTLSVPHHQVGVEAARMLLEAIDEPDRAARSVLLPLSLKVRGSTAPPPPGA